MSKRRTFIKSVAAASAAAGSMTLGSASLQAAPQKLTRENLLSVHHGTKANWFPSVL